MAITRETIVYDGPGGRFEGMIARPSGTTPAPGILVAPTWMGQSDFENGQAEALAGLGYVGFAIDLYGQGKRPASQDEAAAAMTALDGDRPLLQARMHAALDRLRADARVDPTRVAAIGYCFGGKCVLDLARSGADIAAVASFHGVYDAPANIPAPTIAAKILVLHGWDDPLGPPEAYVGLCKELTTAGADWQAIAYGRTGHAFTHPGAQMREAGLYYQPDSARRSWDALTALLAETF